MDRLNYLQYIIPIHHVDKDILVVEKPAELLSVPGKGPEGQICLSNALLEHLPNTRVIHRLDMATSGLMLFALNHGSQKHLGQHFQKRLVHKSYQARVDGIVEADYGAICVPLICDWERRPKQKVCFQSGKPALTCFRTLHREEHNGTTRLQLMPVTGRSHQLRVHAQWFGHPILGDRFYSHPHRSNSEERLLLHANSIEFLHPNGRQLSFRSDPPF